MKINPNDLALISERVADMPRWKPYLKGLDGTRRNFTAMLLENQRQFLFNKGIDADAINETTKVAQIGHFDKFAFPIIRAVYPNLIANDLVSVQPMAGPVSMVFYMDMLFGNTKGNITAGSSAFDARTGPANTEYYSQNIVPSETITEDNDNISHTLAKLPVKPGTVRISMTHSGGTCVMGDDGNGGWLLLSGTALATPGGAIDYTTGVMTITGGASTITAATGTYRYEQEANDNVMQVDMQLASAPVVAEVRKMRVRWSLEAAQNLNALFGLDAEAELVGAMSELIKHELDRQIINELYSFASGGTVSWDKTLPPAVSWDEHKKSFKDALIAANNLVFSKTRRVQTNWIVAGIDVCTVIESHPEFKAAPGALDTQAQSGVVYIGTIADRWKVYKDPYFPATKWLQGYKGGQFLDAGYVYAPYIPLYTTPTVVLDDFMGRKGAATQYGTKAVNSLYYATGSILNVT